MPVISGGIRKSRHLRHLLPTFVVLAALARPLAAQRIPIELERVGSIGVLQGDPEEEFGTIVGLEILDDPDLILILDAQRGSLSAFDREGSFLASTGRIGQGPGEFGVPRSVSTFGERIFTYDASNVRITEYRWRSDGVGFELHEEVRAPFAADRMCAVEDHLYLAGYLEGKIVHRFDPGTGELTSFGSPFRSGHYLIEESTADGWITCDESSSSIFIGAFVTPLVRRYDPSGALIWEATIPDFPATLVRTNEYGGVTYTAPEGQDKDTLLVSLLVVPGVGLLAQYGEPDPGIRSLEDLVNVRTAIFSIDDGSLIASGITSLPRIDLVKGDFAYSRGNDPFPRVQIYRYR